MVVKVDFAKAPVDAVAQARGRVRSLLQAALSTRDDVAIAAYLATKAQLAYLEEDVVAEVIQQEGGEDLCQFRSGWSKGFGYRFAGHSWIALRGTHSLAELIATDGNCLPTGWPLRHCGFLLAWHRIRNQVVTWSNKLSAAEGLWITGHSLGGALAFLCAFELAPSRPLSGVITFGAPRPGLFHFHSRYGSAPLVNGSTLGAITRRYTHGTDLVSRVPPPLPYCHVGDEYSVRDNGGIEVGRPMDLVERALLRWEAFEAKRYASVRVEAQTPNYTALQAAVRPPRPIIPGLAPWWQLPADQRRLAAWSKVLSMNFGFWVIVLTALPVVIIWAVLASVGIVLLRVMLIDVQEHFCARYVAAFAKRAPGLAIGADVRSAGQRVADALRQIFRRA